MSLVGLSVGIGCDSGAPPTPDAAAHPAPTTPAASKPTAKRGEFAAPTQGNTMLKD
jgi:hypothetical protein